MKDTPEEWMLIQHQIFLTKSIEERFYMGMQMIDDGLKLCEESIRNSTPGISEKELKIEVFKRMYQNDFSNEELNNIIHYFRT